VICRHNGASQCAAGDKIHSTTTDTAQWRVQELEKAAPSLQLRSDVLCSYILHHPSYCEMMGAGVTDRPQYPFNCELMCYVVTYCTIPHTAN